MEKATAVFNSPEFKKQMENAILNDADFQRKMADAQKQMAKAAEVFESPEFKQRIDEITRKADENARRFEGPSSPEEAAPTK
jgi:hypothetical protein